jgi:hypothetical protein
MLRWGRKFLQIPELARKPTEVALDSLVQPSMSVELHNLAGNGVKVKMILQVPPAHPHERGKRSKPILFVLNMPARLQPCPEL